MDGNKEKYLQEEMKRLLSHLAPEVEPASDFEGLFWQIDNACVRLLRYRLLTQRPPDGALVVRDSSGVVTCSVCGTGLGVE